MMSPSRFLAASCIDWIAGDPHGMPHPVRWIGSAISTGERHLRRPDTPANEMLRGAALTVTVVGGTWTAARIALRAGAIGEILLAWTTLATRSLLDESAAVVDAVERGDLVRARSRLARIVGRDTESLDEPEILRAVIETVAEGLCDGVVAPIVYLAMGGVPLAFAYKAVNTLDSMIGHPEPPYRYFGRVAARLDDFANFVPARMAALAIVAAASVVRRGAQDSWRVFLRDGSKHSSPNAGQTEAAMAGALGVRLGGMNYYGGKPAPKPLLAAEGRFATPADARAALRIAGVASLIVTAGAWVWLRWRSEAEGATASGELCGMNDCSRGELCAAALLCRKVSAVSPREESARSVRVLTFSNAGTLAQCHMVLPCSGAGTNCGADPPGGALWATGRPRPATLSKNQAVPQSGGPARGPAADLGGCPTTNAESRSPEDCLKNAGMCLRTPEAGEIDVSPQTAMGGRGGAGNLAEARIGGPTAALRFLSIPSAWPNSPSTSGVRSLGIASLAITAVVLLWLRWRSTSA